MSNPIIPTSEPTLAEKFWSTEIQAIGRADQIDLLSSIITKLTRDLGKKPDDDAISHILSSLIQTLNRRYKAWRVSDLFNAFEYGKIGNYGSSYTINVANIESWLFQHNNAEVHPRIVRDNIKEQTRMRNQTATLLEGANWHGECADALLWRLKLLDSIKGRKFNPVKLPADYIEQKKRINSIPLDRIIDALAKRSTRQLLAEFDLNDTQI